MERYLLFDSGCSTCTKIARAIEQEIEGPFTVRSLRDPEVQELLNRASPGWSWEPTWLEVRDGTVRAYTGLAMGLWLVRTLGPRQALRLMKLVNRHSASRAGVGPADPGRRHFLQRSGSAFAALALLLGWPKSLLFRESIAETPPQQVPSNQAQQELAEGELWEGFLLLPAGASVPDFVKPGQAIALHGSGENLGKVVTFGSIEELRNQVPFPLYIPLQLPPGFDFVVADITRFQRSDAIWSATLSFLNPNSEHEEQIAHISLVAVLEYPRPFPIWPVHDPRVPGEVVVNPEKVTLPNITPGLMLPSARGHLLHWIDNDILYMLVAEHSLHRESAETIAKSLVRVD